MDTKTKILDSAEQLFAHKGPSGVSLRQIISKANVNLAAIHYHFGGKAQLLKEVLNRRLIPLNEERISLLNKFEESSVNNEIPLNQIIEALVGPALRLSRDKSKGGAVFMKLLGRLVLEPNQDVQDLLTIQFETVLNRFMPALRRALPKLKPVDFFWRTHFLVGAMAHTMADSERIMTISGGVCDPDDTEGNIKRLVSFLAAGLGVES